MSKVTKEVFGRSHDAMHVFCDVLGVEIQDRISGIVQYDEIKLIVAVVAMREHLLEISLTGQTLGELTIILIKEFDYLLQTRCETVSIFVRIITKNLLFWHCCQLFSILFYRKYGIILCEREEIFLIRVEIRKTNKNANKNFFTSPVCCLFMIKKHF